MSAGDRGRPGRWARAATFAAVTVACRPAVAAPPGALPPDAASAAKDDAVAHFDRGLALLDQGAWAAALAEFLEARRLYPLRNAVYQAGLCLENLKRYDEALDRFEATLRELGGAAPPDVKARVERKVAEMRDLVGELAIVGAEPGATVTVDGLPRGEHPETTPLRLPVGSHLVRVSRAGFESFEARILVAAGQTARLTARLAPLGPSGRARIAEQGGGALEVLVDGRRVGTSPWEGPLSPGPHVVVLRGEGDQGTPPAQLLIEVDRTTPLTLAAAELGAALRVEPTPIHAGVAIDGVTVGRGIWDGRLPAGMHEVEIAAPGFLTARQELTLARGGHPVARVALQRDPRSPFAGQAPRFTAELAVGVPQLAAFYGQVGDACTGACKAPIGFTGYAVARGGYELGSRVAFGITAGALSTARRYGPRDTSVAPVGTGRTCAATADDSLRMRAALAGGWAQVTFGDQVAFHLRLGAGALLGSALDTRSGTVSGCAPAAVAPFTESAPLRAVYLAPEARIGLALGPHVELNAGVEVLLAFDLAQPTWSGVHGGVAWNPPAGTETFASPRMIAFIPGLGTRYDF